MATGQRSGPSKSTTTIIITNALHHSDSDSDSDNEYYYY